MAHTNTGSRPRLGQVNDVNTRRAASYGNHVRSEGESWTFVMPVNTVVLAIPGRPACAVKMNTFLASNADVPPYQHTNFAFPDSWVEISSQPSSSSLSSANDEIVTTGLRVQHHHERHHRRRVVRPGAPSALHITARASSAGGTSSQDEYEESESESDRVMTSSGEGPFIATVDRSQRNSSPNNAPHDQMPSHVLLPLATPETEPSQWQIPISHPPSSRPANRRSLPSYSNQSHHLPQNILSPSYNAAAHHDEALRSSLNTLLSCAAAARNLSKPNVKSPQQQQQQQTVPRDNRVDPMSFRLIPESALPNQHQHQTQPPIFQEPTFKPTLRRTSTSTTSNNSPSPGDRITKEAAKRKTSPSKSRRSSPAKKSRHSTVDPASVSPTLLTWVVSAGVVVVLSAISFSAGYSLGREAGLLEANGSGAGLVDIGVGREAGCAREVAGRSMGLKRSLARGAVQV
ncbi:hypothetical protein Q7P37_009601 [Cladosporium fusiforme]